jgi:hypothetical protein
MSQKRLTDVKFTKDILFFFSLLSRRDKWELNLNSKARTFARNEELIFQIMSNPFTKLIFSKVHTLTCEVQPKLSPR